MLKDNLVKIGFTPNEAQAYIFLMNNYKAKASEIARHLNVTHPAAKKILDNLIKNELIRSGQYGKTTLYFPEEGEKIVDYVEREHDSLQKKYNKKLEIADSISRLIKGKIALEKDAETNIHFYKGKEGIEKMVNGITDSKDTDVLEFQDIDLVLYSKSSDKHDTAKKYKDKDIKFITLYTSSDDTEHEPNELQKELVKIDKDTVSSPTAHMMIYDDKVAFSFITDDRTILIIENQWIVNTLRTLFLNLKSKMKR